MKVKGKILFSLILIILMSMLCGYAKPSTKLNKSAVTVNAGSTYALKATVAGADRTVEWNSDNTDVAVVSEGGVVTGVSEGTAIITASANGIDSTCKVDVNPVINATSAKLNVSDFYELQIIGTDKRIVWSSSDVNVASVSSKGVVKAIKPGKATIQARVGNKYYKCNITVVTSSIVLSKNDITLYAGGDTGNTVNIKATMKGANSNAIWETSDESVATVVNGKIVAIAPGEATIKATANNVSAECRVKVVDTQISLDKPYVEIGCKGVGNKVKLNASVTGASTAVTWSSSDKTVATVSGGNVVGKKPGFTVITAKANGVSENCYVEVKEGLSIDETNINLYTDVNDSKVIKTNAPKGTVLDYESSDKNVAIVLNGKVVPVDEGSADITVKATYSDGKVDAATCHVTVIGTSTDIKEESLSLKNKYEGNSCRLNYVVSGKTNKVKWTSSNPKVASVSANGVVTGKSAGNCDIILSANGKNDKVKVSVSEYDPKISLNISKYALYTVKGNSVTLKATPVGPSKNVVWTSDDDSVASVNAAGKVTANSEGIATITATSNGVSADCKIEVIESQVLLNSTSLTIGKGDTKELEVDVIGQTLNYTVKSTNSKVAAIKNGIISGVNYGSADIIVTANGIQKVCHVEVGDCEHEYAVCDEVEADCTNDGYKLVKCTKCGDSYKEIIEKIGHDFGEDELDAAVIEKLPTCSETGIVTYICMHCGLRKSISVDPAGHSFSLFTINEEAATCEKDGSKTYICITCREATKVETIPATGHSFEMVITPPTDDSEGKKEVICSSCGYVYSSEIIPATECKHLSKSYTTVKPTCSAEGYDLVTCDNCDYYSMENYVPKLEHNYASEIIKPATCQEVGIKTYTCSMCKDTYTEELNKTPHDNSGDYIVIEDSTCSKYGKKVKKCTICDEVLSTYSITKKPHEYEWVVVKEATVIEEGLEENACKYCGAILQQRDIPKLTCKHEKLRWEVVKEATCVEPKIKKAICEDCNEIIIDNYVTNTYDTSNHVNTTESTIAMPTYKKDGIKKITCLDCGYYYTTDIPKLICKHTRTGITRDDDGQYWVTCTDCDKILGPSTRVIIDCKHTGYGRTRRLIQRLGENQDGIWVYSCNNCGEEVSRTVYPGYQIYTVDIGNGQTAKICGYYVNDMSKEVWQKTNEYRSENGRNTLDYASQLQEFCDIRAVECAYKFSHDRPNGTKWYTLDITHMNGENLALGFNTSDSVMTAWKDSPGHNENLLYPPFKSLAVSTFVKYSLTDTDSFPAKTWISAQTFSSYSGASLEKAFVSNVTMSSISAFDAGFEEDELLSGFEEDYENEDILEEPAEDEEIIDIFEDELETLDTDSAVLDEEEE